MPHGDNQQNQGTNGRPFVPVEKAFQFPTEFPEMGNILDSVFGPIMRALTTESPRSQREREARLATAPSVTYTSPSQVGSAFQTQQLLGRFRNQGQQNGVAPPTSLTPEELMTALTGLSSALSPVTSGFSSLLGDVSVPQTFATYADTTPSGNGTAPFISQATNLQGRIDEIRQQLADPNTDPALIPDLQTELQGLMLTQFTNQFAVQQAGMTAGENALERQHEAEIAALDREARGEQSELDRQLTREIEARLERQFNTEQRNEMARFAQTFGLDTRKFELTVEQELSRKQELEASLALQQQDRETRGLLAGTLFPGLNIPEEVLQRGLTENMMNLLATRAALASRPPLLTSTQFG